MRKLILKWLFGTDDVEKYYDSLCNHEKTLNEHIELINEHIELLNDSVKYLEMLKKLSQLCAEKGVNVDEEMAEFLEYFENKKE